MVVPFDLQKMDIYNASDQYVDVYVRTATGAWYWWSGLSGAGSNDGVTFMRWAFSQDVPAKVVATVWRTTNGTVGSASVGRISVKE